MLRNAIAEQKLAVTNPWFSVFLELRSEIWELLFSIKLPPDGPMVQSLLKCGSPRAVMCRLWMPTEQMGSQGSPFWQVTLTNVSSKNSNLDFPTPTGVLFGSSGPPIHYPSCPFRLRPWVHIPLVRKAPVLASSALRSNTWDQMVFKKKYIWEMEEVFP